MAKIVFGFLLLLVLGSTLNIVTLILNNGKMPVKPISDLDFAILLTLCHHKPADSNSRLYYLSDIIILPDFLLGKQVSFGDILIFFGLGGAILTQACFLIQIGI